MNKQHLDFRRLRDVSSCSSVLASIRAQAWWRRAQSSVLFSDGSRARLMWLERSSKMV